MNDALLKDVLNFDTHSRPYHETEINTSSHNRRRLSASETSQIFKSRSESCRPEMRNNLKRIHYLLFLLFNRVTKTIISNLNEERALVLLEMYLRKSIYGKASLRPQNM